MFREVPRPTLMVNTLLKHATSPNIWTFSFLIHLFRQHSYRMYIYLQKCTRRKAVVAPMFSHYEIKCGPCWLTYLWYYVGESVYSGSKNEKIPTFGEGMSKTSVYQHPSKAAGGSIITSQEDVSSETDPAGYIIQLNHCLLQIKK